MPERPFQRTLREDHNEVLHGRCIRAHPTGSPDRKRSPFPITPRAGGIRRQAGATARVLAVPCASTRGPHGRAGAAGGGGRRAPWPRVAAPLPPVGPEAFFVSETRPGPSWAP